MHISAMTKSWFSFLMKIKCQNNNQLNPHYLNKIWFSFSQICSLRHKIKHLICVKQRVGRYSLAHLPLLYWDIISNTWCEWIKGWESHYTEVSLLSVTIISSKPQNNSMCFTKTQNQMPTNHMRLNWAAVCDNLCNKKNQF